MEAYLHKHDTLPHLHGDLEKRFPKAVTQEEEEETEEVDLTALTFETYDEDRTELFEEEYQSRFDELQAYYDFADKNEILGGRLSSQVE